MPTILIKEVDQTSAVGSTITDIAYVPGLMGLGKDGNVYTGTYNTPVLCSTVKEFEAHFGVKPDKLFSSLTASQNISYNDVTMLTVDAASNIDKSYVYAKELINAGMPVLYEAIKPALNNKQRVYMGACNYTEAKAKTAESITIIESDPEVEDNGNNTLSLINASGEKHLYVKIPNGATDENGEVITTKKYYVTISAGKDAVIKDIYYGNTALGTGTKLENPSDCFVTNPDNKYYLVHIVFNSKEPVNDLEYVRVMVNDEGYMPFECFGTGKEGVNYLYSVLSERLGNLVDKSEYDVKYITCGGYPTFAETEQTIAKKMIAVAANRGDCVALPDHVNESSRVLVGPGSLYSSAIKDVTFSDGTYGSMFTPYAEYTCTTLTENSDQVMPASFGYLMCVAKAVQTSPNWLAMAGVTRGVVPSINHLTCKQTLSNVVADEYQPRSNGTSINAITNVKPYGLTVWGNRTLARAGDELKAANFLNTRNMISDIKKQAYTTARSCMFEQDSDTMWLKFKSGVTPLLDSLKSGYGISNYKLIKSNKGINGETLGKGQVGVIIKIYPIYAVEYFEISVVIADDVQVS